MKKFLPVLSMLVAGCASIGTVPEPPRLAPRTVHGRMERGDPILLVCAYEARKCPGTHPEGCLSLEEFERREDDLPRDLDIVFC